MSTADFKGVGEFGSSFEASDGLCYYTLKIGFVSYFEHPGRRGGGSVRSLFRFFLGVSASMYSLFGIVCRESGGILQQCILFERHLCCFLPQILVGSRGFGDTAWTLFCSLSLLLVSCFRDGKELGSVSRRYLF